MKNKIIIIFAIILTAFTGCSGNTANNQQPKQQQLSFEKNIKEAPKDLEKIEESIEKIFLALNGPASNVEKDKNNQDLKDNKDKKEEKGENNQDSSKEGKKEGERKKQQDKNFKMKIKRKEKKNR